MDKIHRLTALLLALVMLFALAACGASEAETEEADAPAEEPTPTPEPTPEPPLEEAEPLVIGCSALSGVFSPFFSSSEGDKEVTAVTQLPLLPVERGGSLLPDARNGEVFDFNGSPYTYYGASSMTVTENDDGTVYYDFILRSDLTFTDGEPLTADDVIFTMYALCDPTYNGGVTFATLPIEGLAVYQGSMDSLWNRLIAAGRDNTDFRLWSEDTQAEFWERLDRAGEAFAREVMDFCADFGLISSPDDAAGAAAIWGVGRLDDGADAAELFTAMCRKHDWDMEELSASESAGSSLFDLMEDYASYTVGIDAGEAAGSIAGIQKTGERTLRLVLTEPDATAMYELAIPIAPMHYYGDERLYDYDNDQFGFPKGDLRRLRERDAAPLGAGAYIFMDYADGLARFVANTKYIMGRPEIPRLDFLSCRSDAEKLRYVEDGTVHVAELALTDSTVSALEATENPDLQVVAVDSPRFGYIGLNANVVNVGGVSDSVASMSFRTGLAVVLAAFRQEAVEGYFGPLASVIEYPVSASSWAAPIPEDQGYEAAFSKTVGGEDIYTDGMTDEERTDAALDAALGWFEAAGCTVEDGRVTAVPAGASLTYTAWVPGNGAGDHPACALFLRAAEALSRIGITLEVKDVIYETELWRAIQSQQAGIWAAAWGSDAEPDLFPLYFSGAEGVSAGNQSYVYGMSDPKLDALLLLARNADQAERRRLYKRCFDIIMEWAVVLPFYQPRNAIVFDGERFDASSLPKDITTFYNWRQALERLAAE